jgi:hypothetical protein
MKAIAISGMPIYYIISALIVVLFAVAAVYRYYKLRKAPQSLQMAPIQEDPLLVDFKASVEQVKALSDDQSYSQLAKKIKTVHEFTQDEYTKLIAFCVRVFNDAAKTAEDKRDQFLEKIAVLVQPLALILKDASETLERLHLSRLLNKSIKSVSNESALKWCSRVKSTLDDDVRSFFEGHCPANFKRQSLTRREFISGKSHLRIYAESHLNGADEAKKQEVVDCLIKIKQELYNNDDVAFSESLNGCWDASNWVLQTDDDIKESLGLR